MISWYRQGEGVVCMQQSLIERCKALKLANVPRIYQDLPFTEPEQFLTALFDEELKARRLKRITG